MEILGRILNYEGVFIKIHSTIILLISIFYAVNILNNDDANVSLYFILILIPLLTIHYILIKVNFFNKAEIYFVFRGILLIIASFACFDNAVFVKTVGISVYLLLFVETIIVGCKYSKQFNYIMMAVGFFPIILVNIVIILFDRFNNKFTVISFFETLIMFVIVYGFLKIVTQNIKELYEEINNKTDLFIQAEKANEQLKDTQKKFITAHDQLTKQKLDLEQAYVKLNRASSEMYIQNELLKYISSSLEIEELMEMVTDSIIGAIGVDTCSIIIYDIIKDCYFLKIKTTYNMDYTSSMRKNLNTGKFDYYFNSNKVFTDNDVDTAKYPFLDNRSVGSLIIMPLIRNHLTYGLLIAEKTAINNFIDNIQFFEGIATQINIAINNANLYAKMEDMAIRDGLTGVYNRSFLQKRFKELVNDVVINNNHLIVALYDIDKFKRVNDTYGHLFGDEALKAAALISEKIVTMNNGVVGRYGGEEFVFMFHNKTLNEVLPVIEKVHESIKNHKLFHNGEEIHINVSIGVTAYPDICEKPEELLKRADLAMYYSKQNGRGRITVDNENLDEMIKM